MAKSETIITKRTACEVLAPTRMTQDEFNALTQDERNSVVGEAAAYDVLCGAL
jgi:hypothetical protein